ncbi:TBCC-domain-containing protein [Agrocybe pediades]|nr:TBCC-domain-containing protein [Agrocybe pediades]
MDTWAFSQSFTAQFQTMRSELETQITAVKSASSSSANDVQQLSVLLAKAAKALADATGSLPSYDQKQYELQLKSFEKSIEELRVSTAPKSKFAFKRKQPQNSSSTPPPTSSKNAAQAADAPLSSSSTMSSSNLVLFSHSYKYLTRHSLPEHPQQTDLSVSDLDHCIVDLLPASDGETPIVISALHARNLSNCIILLPSIEGSALLHDLSQCIIVLGSHQFRMHSSKQIDVFLSISSNPIIEDCNAIRFAQYPKALLSPEAQNKESPDYAVQDFSHIRPTPSPHFAFMNDESKESIEQWIVKARQDPTSVDRLRDVLPH